MNTQSQQVPSESVVIAIDNSEHAKRAFDFYARQFASPQAEIVLVHAVDPPLTYSGAPHLALPPPHTGGVLNSEITKSREAANRLKDIFLSSCSARNLQCRWVQVESEPAVAIIDAIKSFRANLVVMGSRGNGTLRRTILGSVSDYIVHHTNIASVIVPPRDKNAV